MYTDRHSPLGPVLALVLGAGACAPQPDPGTPTPTPTRAFATIDEAKACARGALATASFYFRIDLDGQITAYDRDTTSK